MTSSPWSQSAVRVSLPKNYVTDPRFWFFQWLSLYLTLSGEGIRIPRIRVQQMLKEIDPEGSEPRRIHRLKRQVSVNQCPNYA